MPLLVVDLRKRRVAKHTHTLSLTCSKTHAHTHTHVREGQARVNLLSRFDVLAGLSWHQ